MGGVGKRYLMGFRGVFRKVSHFGRAFGGWLSLTGMTTSTLQDEGYTFDKTPSDWTFCRTTSDSTWILDVYTVF